MSEELEELKNIYDVPMSSKLENQRALIDQQTKCKRGTPLIIQPNLNGNRLNSSHRRNQSERRTSGKENEAFKSTESDLNHVASPASGIEVGAGEPVVRSGNLVGTPGCCYPFDVTETVSLDNGSDDVHTIQTDLDPSLNREDCKSRTTLSTLDMSHDDSVDRESLFLPVVPTQKKSQSSTLQNAYQVPDDIIQTHIETMIPQQNVEDGQQKLDVKPRKKKNRKKKEKKQRQIVVNELQPDEAGNSDSNPQVSTAMAQAPIVDISDVEDFIRRPIPHGVTIKCRVTRDKSGMDRNIYPTYFLHFEQDSGRKVFLLGGRKRKKSTTSNYVISTDPSDLSRSGKSCCGKLRSNLLGTQFTLYGCGGNPRKSGHDDARQELTAIAYESNILGLKGPRRMTVITPQIESELKPHGAHDGLIERWKRKDTKDLLKFHNKAPVWNEEAQTHTLNFSGRVTQASVKNFQIVNNNDVDYIVMQFGKVSENVFTMDYSHPLCALQAFGIALSSFDGKLACE